MNNRSLLEEINNDFNLKNSKNIMENLRIFLFQNRTILKFQKHPLGFKYLKLGDISEKLEFRLHFWSNLRERQDEDLLIHDHSFDFESLILNGSITNNEYNILKAPNTEGYIYDVKFLNDQSRLILSSKNYGIFGIQSNFFCRGDFYKMPNHIFHESINNEDQTVTLLKILKSENKIARVFSPKKLGTLSRFERTFLSLEDSSQLIDKIINFTKV